MHQLLQRLERLLSGRPCLRAERLAEDRQHLGIDAVGLGERADGFGEQARAQRVDDRHGQAALAERAMGQAMILGRCLHHDQLHVVLGQQALEAPQTVPVVGDTAAVREGMEVDIEMVFTDVATDVDWLRASCFEQNLALHTGLAPYHLFRTGAKDRRTRLIHGSMPRGARSRRSGSTRAAARVEPAQILTDSRHTEHARGPRR
jgi:hypothetical protein